MTSKPWDRRPDETDEAWDAFGHYRDLGAARTIPKAVEAAGKKPGNVRSWERWSSKHEWTLRVRAWDGFLDAEAQRRIKALAVARRVRQAQLGQALQGVAGQALTRMSEEVKAGKRVPRGHEIAALAKAGFDIEAVAEGDPNEILGGSGLEVRLVNVRDLPKPGDQEAST